MPQRSHRWYWILFGFLVVLGLQHACQKDNPLRPETAANVRIKLLQADPKVIGLGESTVVRAVVVQGPEPGTPVPGARVYFGEVGGPSPGEFPAIGSVTSDLGVAEMTFGPFTGAPGSLGIWARVDGTTEKKYETIVVMLDSTRLDVAASGGTRLPVDDPTGLPISVVATTILTEGAERSPIAGLTIVLTAGDQFADSNGNGVYDPGEPVPSDGDRNGDGLFTAEGTLPEHVTTDERGVASFRYLAGHAVGPVYLRLTGLTGNGVGQVIRLEQISLARIVTLVSETSEMLADSVSQATVTASVQGWALSPGVGWVLSPAANAVLFCTAGEPFTDASGNGFYDAGETFDDVNGNHRWDPMGSVPSSVRTGSDGTAVVIYTAGAHPGTATVRATTAGGDFGALGLELLSVSPARGLEVTLSPAPPNPLYADGLGSVNGCVAVTDANGGALPGKRVTIVIGEKFRDVNADGVFTPGTDLLLDDVDNNGAWTSAGTVTVNGPSDANGRACFELAVGRVPMHGWIHAAVDGVIAEAALELELPLPICLITVAPTFETMTVLGGGGVTCNTLLATCTTCDGLPAPAGLGVRFCLTAGPGGGERLENAVVGCIDAVTGASGTAIAVLYSGTTPGWVRVIATSGAAASAPMGIYLEPGTTLAVSTPNDQLDLPADGATELEVCVTAATGTEHAPLAGVPLVCTAGDRFTDTNGNGLYDQGEAIPAGGDRNGNGRWDAEGSFSSGAATDAQGRACVTYRAGPSVGPVYLRVTGGGVFHEITVQQHSSAFAVTLESVSHTLLADGVSQATVLASVRTWAQLPVSELLRCTAGEPFTDTNRSGFHDPVEAFEDLNGNGSWDAIGSVPASVTTGPDGTASFTYTAGTHPGTVTVRATTAAGGFAVLELELASVSPAGGLDVALTPPLPDPLYADGVTTVHGLVTVTGLAGEPLTGKVVRMVAGERFQDADGDGAFTPGADWGLVDVDHNGSWTSAGTVTMDGSGLTGADGKVGFTMRVGAVPMLAWVHAAVDGVIAEESIDIAAPLPICSVALEPTFESMTILGGGGVTCNTLTASLLACNGLPAPAGTAVRFCLTNGPGGGVELENAVVGCLDTVTNADGQALAVLYSGTVSGWVRIAATSGTASSTMEIFLEPSALRLVVELGPPDPPYYANGVMTVEGSVSATKLTGAAAGGKPVTGVVGEHFDDVNADGYFTPGVDRLDDTDDNGRWTSAGTLTVRGTRVTGGDGRAMFDIVCGLIPTHAWVHIAVGGVTTDVEIDLVAPPPVCLVTLEPTFESMTVLGDDGAVCNTFIATCRLCDDQPAPAGTVVRFCLTAGPGGGEHLEGAVAGCVNLVTDTEGKARGVFWSGTTIGWATVRATSGSASGSHGVYIGRGSVSSVATIACAADSSWLMPGNQCEVRAVLSDLAHNPVADGTPVRFTVDEGVVQGSDAPGISYTQNGVATATFTAPVSSADGVANVVASTPTAAGGVLQCTSAIHVRLDGGSDEISAAYLTCAADSSFLAPGSQCRVRTVVSDASRNPVADGTPVRFTADVGLVQGANGPGVSYTVNGMADAIFTAPSTSTGTVAQIVASTPTAAGGLLQCTSDVQILVGGTSEPVTAVYLTCAADSAQLSPGNECRVWARISDAAHNPVADGTPVHFTVEEGVVQGADGPGVSYAQSGVAEATFTAPSSSADGVANVVASTESAAGGTLLCTSSIQISGGSGTSCSVTLVPALPEISVRGTGAIDQTLLRARLFDCRDLPMGAGERVAFVIAAGPGGGETFTSCACDSVIVLTDGTGTAEITLRAGTRSGTVEVRARALSTTGVAAHSPVAIASGPPAYLAAGVTECNVLACNIVGAENGVTALVYDIYHNPVRDGTAVYFTTSYGMVTGSSGLGSSTTVGGIVTGTWYTTGECGIDSIAVSTLGGAVVDTVAFIGSGPAHTATFLVPAAASVAMNADGVSTQQLRISVLDENDLYVLPMTPELELTPEDGDVTVEPTADGCNASTARGVYTAPVLDSDRSNPGQPDDGIGGTVTVAVTAGYGPHGDTFQVVLHTGPASGASSELDLGTSMRPGDLTFFTITVKDAWGNPLGGHRLTLTATDGVITAEGVSDSYGVIGGLSYTAPAAPATVYVEVRDMDPTYSGNMILRQTVTVAP